MTATEYFPKSERMTRDEIRKQSVPIEEFQAYLDAGHTLPSMGDPSNILATRTKVSAELILASLPPAPPTVTEEQISIPLSDGHSSRAWLTKPSNPSSPGPLVILFHGGGFIMGHPETQLTTARLLATIFNASVICPCYRLAPEHPFPTGATDAFDITTYCGTNASSLGADPTQGFLVGGSSAGGNFAAVLARHTVAQNMQPPLTGHWVGYAVFRSLDDDAAAVGLSHMPASAQKYADIWGMSFAQNVDAPIVGAAAGKALSDLYQADFNSPLYNPLVTSPAFDLKKMSRAFVQTAGMDFVRDDGIVYAYVLEDEGVEVRLRAYGGLPHVFPAFVPGLEASRSAVVDTLKGFGWLLGNEVPEEKIVEVLSMGKK